MTTIQPLLKLALEPATDQRRILRLRWRTALLWSTVALVAAVLLAAGIRSNLGALALAAVAAVGAVVIHRRAAAWEPDYRVVARMIEQRHPELHALLITAVEQQPDPHTGQLTFLQRRVVQEAVAESRRHQWLDATPAWQRAGAPAAKLAVLIAMLLALAEHFHSATGNRGAAVTEAASDVAVTPGDASLERGSGLIITAKFLRDVPGEAMLVVQPRNGPATRLALVKNLDDPVFGGGLPEVEADLSYRIEYAGRATRDFAVTVFEHPRLERADARLRFPAYTKLPEKEIADTRRLSAVEGTKLDVAFRLNKPVKSATLVSKSGAKIPLTIDPENAAVSLKDFQLEASHTYELRLEDADGRANKIPAQLVVDVLPNRVPELKLATPKGDQRVSPLHEVAFQAEAWDDFGLGAWGISYTVAGSPAQEVALGAGTQPDQRVEGRHLLKLEELGVQPDQLLSWFLWAEDTGPDGRTRRTASDMFFAEVRPFEEIYRVGAGGAGGAAGEGGAGAATKLAELQKQIVTATWNLKRAEDARGAATPSPQYLKDEPVIRDSQAEALRQIEEAREKIEDARSLALVENVAREMKSAHERLGEAEKSTAPLPAALTAEQAAYNALLKLAAHEFNVTRSQQGEKGGGESGGRQEQLEQLEMKEEQDRYETKTEAAPPQNEEQREQLAILSRLKELAQRQQDINERLKELQTALQEAKTEVQKEEVRRQLKRLREEEQQLLADLDETRQKMEQSPNQARFADERKQLEQTRGEAQQSAESMERNDPAQALASGTRAQRDLQELRDDFRKKSSGQFSEEMRRMRADAREMARSQEELAEKLEENAKPTANERRTLDGSSAREQLAQQFQKQQERLGGLREGMRNVSEQAEAGEPLLAKELYDALRKNSQAATDETLQRAGQLASRGYAQHAQKFEQKARQEIDELKSGVERAAESVLGNEEEALRQARAELDALSQQLNREIAQANPALADAGNPRDNAGPSQPGEGQEPGAGESGASQSSGKDPQPNDDSSQPGTGQPGTPAGRQAMSGSQPDSANGKGRAGNPSDDPAQTADASRPGRTGQGKSESADPSQQPDSREGRQNSQQASNAQQPGQGPAVGQPQQGGQGQQAGEGAKPGEQGGKGGQQAANTPGQSGAGLQSPDGADQPGARLRELASAAPRQRGGIGGGAGDGGGNQGGGIDHQEGPLRGDGFVQWSDRLRNVEEMLDDPALRNEAARVREIARSVRAEFKRHSKEPQWDVVKTQIGMPLGELRNRLTEELARRASRDSLVPIDRDPVPTKYTEQVRRYYEDLGRSRD